MRTALLTAFFCVTALSKPTIVVGSKIFTESYVLAEIAAQVIEDAGEAKVERRFGLGQTGIAFEALRNGKVDLLPEYTGTIAEALLKQPKLTTPDEIRLALAAQDLTVGEPLGFNNTYALAVKTSFARERHWAELSDLGPHPSVRAGFSHEFLEREDCYPRVRQVYGIEFPSPKGLSHGLAYEALARGEIEITDIYSTDAKILKYHLSILTDDKHAFPSYLAVLLARGDFPARFPKSWKALRTRLEGQITGPEITRLNGLAEIDHQSFSAVARDFLGGRHRSGGSLLTHRVMELARQHLTLVFVSLLVSLLFGLPLAVAASRSRVLGQLILLSSGLIQTIPSLALLCFLIPFFGIGTLPALVALFLYGLLPIVRNAYLGLTGIDPKLLEVARALGLSGWQSLTRVELPLATPAILSGIKTSAIINVGTATLAALIGAGGFGVPIVTGLALNDLPTILEGAVPAAIMALGVHALFEGLDRLIIPRGLRLRAESNR